MVMIHEVMISPELILSVHGPMLSFTEEIHVTKQNRVYMHTSANKVLNIMYDFNSFILILTSDHYTKGPINLPKTALNGNERFIPECGIEFFYF